MTVEGCAYVTQRSHARSPGRFCHCQQLGVAGETEDEVGVQHCIDYPHQFRCAEMAVTAHQDMDGGGSQGLSIRFRHESLVHLN